MMKALCVCLLVLLAVSVNSTDACGGGDRSCGGTCYSPRTHTCINGYFLCPVGHRKCGTHCYNPRMYRCT
ncbi:hypothetical protein BOX15_Mlig018268g1 [Macrostomum lignano]|uniref:Endo-1,3(4)-beta-glucanase 1 carbohydrate binding domain-containing protein n=1 Tax=Macrostomum lignano TaxID=282301 RepID=A0A267DBQ1_9PLAT|nr:hypothetical protein BOX15_Mlig018268g2 [Macrostomum lignano]PAA69175.1 hypothetical protein BOX15_Mlig018268g1 [Macrostomum lignano]